jgi:hypothetical protein
MFSVLEGIENFNDWVANGPIGWIVLNPLFLSIFIVVLIVILHEYYTADPEDDDDEDSASSNLTKFIVYSFLAVFIPIMINNNVIDRKRMVGSFEMSEEDFY